MVERWTLCRAGITNVYQYTDEILRFGGGRLLLRGVNGSGKSTAMNMLLPFLLDADVRRIDAAGDQTRVLRSWMLSGRDEAQPTGYLWLEMVRGTEHLSFGCGIKANRSSDHVSHWWFVTDRRPGIDLHLVRSKGSGRVPLSTEDLRQELGPGHVWTMDQRPAYRAALHGRLYGGADLDQHVRLLHMVRNPRVGDRVDDAEGGISAHLRDALPQLSDTAIEDAATPLEQLDEHRRNVSDLTATVDTLHALLSTYRDHVRSVLRAQVDSALAQVADHARCRRAARAAATDVTASRSEVDALHASIDELSAAHATLSTEIAQLEASDAYASAADLVHRREAVDQLARAALTAAEQQEGATGRAERDRAEVASHAEAVGEVTCRLGDDLTEVTALATEAGLPVEVTVLSTAEIAEGPIAVDDHVVAVPVDAYSADHVRSQLAAVRTAAHTRTTEVDDALTALDAVDAALGHLSDAEVKVTEASERHADAEGRVGGARAEVVRAAEDWRAAATTWHSGLVAHAAATGAHPPTALDLDDADVEADHEHLHATLTGAADGVLGEHRRAHATAASSHATSIGVRDEAERLVAELSDRDLPEPPATAWQGERAGPCLAEVVDFHADLDEASRTGLEAALEASGLLMAEVRPDGTLAVGDLLLGPGPRVAHPLSALLTVAAPDGLPDALRTRVAQVLDAISTNLVDETDDGDAAAVEASEDGAARGQSDQSRSHAAVSPDGRFRVGPLRGRHTKTDAEHVGISARRAALGRQRAEAAAALADAEAAVARIGREIDALDRHIADAESLRRSIPATASVVKAILAAAEADRLRDLAAAALETARARRDAAEADHARAADHAQRTCATAGLPGERARLAEVRRACERIPTHADLVVRTARELAKAVGAWSSAGRRWEDSQRTALEATERARDARAHHHDAAAALATLEDAIGIDARELFATLDRTKGELRDVTSLLEASRHDLGPARQRLGGLEATVVRTSDELKASEETSVETLARLRAAVAVPGVWTAALATSDTTGAPRPAGETDVDLRPSGAADGRGADAGDSEQGALPVVADSTDGLKILAVAIAAAVPAPRQPVTHEGVRQAIRDRRPTLGAGWDAEDRHPEADLPLAVEVNGPLGRMHLAGAAEVAAEQLATKRHLLTAQQTEALRNLLQGLVAKEVAEKMQATQELIAGMNQRLRSVRTTHGIGTSLRWKRRDDLPDDLAAMIDLLARPPDLRTPDDESRLVAALSARIAEARDADPEADYRALISSVLDYRAWHVLRVVVHRPGAPDSLLSRRTPLSEGEKKIVSYQPLFAAVAASCDALAESAPDAPRFVLLDDAFAKVSEDNHPKLFGLLVELDLDFIATSERLWGTHASVPELAITEVVRDADAGVIVLEHSHWDGRDRHEGP